MSVISYASHTRTCRHARADCVCEEVTMICAPPPTLPHSIPPYFTDRGLNAREVRNEALIFFLGRQNLSSFLGVWVPYTHLTRCVPSCAQPTARSASRATLPSSTSPAPPTLRATTTKVAAPTTTSSNSPKKTLAHHAAQTTSTCATTNRRPKSRSSPAWEPKTSRRCAACAYLCYQYPERCVPLVEACSYIAHDAVVAVG